MQAFVKRGDRDFYEFDLNCKPANEASAAVRRTPNLAELGLPQNVFVWSVKEVSVWLHALGLGEYAQAFVTHHVQGDVIFLLLESHLQVRRPAMAWGARRLTWRAHGDVAGGA